MKHHIKYDHNFQIHESSNTYEEIYECDDCKIKAIRRYVITIGKIPLGWNTEDESEANTPCGELKLRSLLK